MYFYVDMLVNLRCLVILQIIIKNQINANNKALTTLFVLLYYFIIIIPFADYNIQ